MHLYCIKYTCSCFISNSNCSHTSESFSWCWSDRWERIANWCLQNQHTLNIILFIQMYLKSFIFNVTSLNTRVKDASRLGWIRPIGKLVHCWFAAVYNKTSHCLTGDSFTRLHFSLIWATWQHCGWFFFFFFPSNILWQAIYSQITLRLPSCLVYSKLILLISDCSVNWELLQRANAGKSHEYYFTDKRQGVIHSASEKLSLLAHPGISDKTRIYTALRLISLSRPRNEKLLLVFNW